MVYFIASNVYKQVIVEAVTDVGEIASHNTVSDDVHILPFFRKEMVNMSVYDKLIIDMNAIKDLPDEIIQALDMYRVMYGDTRIIIVATNFEPGDELLTKFFQMGIYDLITTDDFSELKAELVKCLSTGKTYKDSVAYKDVKQQLDKLLIHSEIKQSVNKILCAVFGTHPRMGTTHQCILMANYLRTKGFRCCICERNPSQAFKSVQESFDCSVFEFGFSVNNVDYYPDCSDEILNVVTGKAYNFIILDMGSLSAEDTGMVEVNKAEMQFMICGSKPWEMDTIATFFNYPEDILSNYHFLFNYTDVSNQKDIRKGMGALKHVFFTEYTPDPFNSHRFAAGDTIFRKYLPQEEEKRGFDIRRIIGKRMFHSGQVSEAGQI